MAGIAQRAASMSSNGDGELINLDEINALIEDQKIIQEQGQKLLEQNPTIQIGK
jgi:hypothetical protein